MTDRRVGRTGWPLYTSMKLTRIQMLQLRHKVRSLIGLQRRCKCLAVDKWQHKRTNIVAHLEHIKRIRTSASSSMLKLGNLQGMADSCPCFRQQAEFHKFLEGIEAVR